MEKWKDATEGSAADAPPQLRRASQQHFWEEDVEDFLHHELPSHVRQAQATCLDCTTSTSPARCDLHHVQPLWCADCSFRPLAQVWLQVRRRSPIARGP